MNALLITLKIIIITALVALNIVFVTNIVKSQQLLNKNQELREQMDELEILCGQA